VYDKILWLNRTKPGQFNKTKCFRFKVIFFSQLENKKYDFLLFYNIDSFVSEIKSRNKEVGVSRIIAGYSWKWISNKDDRLLDIASENTQLRWNSTNINWVNSTDAIEEVGCIPHAQGHDLQYSGIIFGNEISYAKEKKKLL
jgi:DUF2075 family protein